MDTPWTMPVSENGDRLPKKVLLQANVKAFIEEEKNGFNLKQSFARFEDWLNSQVNFEKPSYQMLVRLVREEKRNAPQVNQEENKQAEIQTSTPEPEISTKTSRVGKAKKALSRFNPLKRPKTPQSEIRDMNTEEERERLLKAEFEALNANLEIKLSFELFKRGYRISWHEWKKRGGDKSTAKEREKICTGLEVQRLYEPHNCCVGDSDWDWTKNIFAQNPYLEPVTKEKVA